MATITSNAAGGGWDQVGTWAGGVVPGAGDYAIIATTGANYVYLESATSIDRITSNKGAHFDTNGFKLTYLLGTDFTMTGGTSTVADPGGKLTMNSGDEVEFATENTDIRFNDYAIANIGEAGTQTAYSETTYIHGADSTHKLGLIYFTNKTSGYIRNLHIQYCRYGFSSANNFPAKGIAQSDQIVLGQVSIEDFGGATSYYAITVSFLYLSGDINMKTTLVSNYGLNGTRLAGDGTVTLTWTGAGGSLRFFTNLDVYGNVNVVCPDFAYTLLCAGVNNFANSASLDITLAGAFELSYLGTVSILYFGSASATFSNFQANNASYNSPFNTSVIESDGDFTVNYRVGGSREPKLFYRGDSINTNNTCRFIIDADYATFRGWDNDQPPQQSLLELSCTGYPTGNGGPVFVLTGGTKFTRSDPLTSMPMAYVTDTTNLYACVAWDGTPNAVDTANIDKFDLTDCVWDAPNQQLDLSAGGIAIYYYQPFNFKAGLAGAAYTNTGTITVEYAISQDEGITFGAYQTLNDANWGAESGYLGAGNVIAIKITETGASTATLSDLYVPFSFRPTHSSTLTTDQKLTNIAGVTDKLGTGLEADGDVYRATENFLEEGGGSGLTAQETADALKLAPVAGAPAAGSAMEILDNIETDVVAIEAAVEDDVPLILSLVEVILAEIV